MKFYTEVYDSKNDDLLCLDVEIYSYTGGVQSVTDRAPEDCCEGVSDEADYTAYIDGVEFDPSCSVLDDKINDAVLDHCRNNLKEIH